ncbi:MAG: type II toxin-antitoxin system RelE/ParE family toxin [Asticcacaulis sp.]|nr:type II toxin-antitoxin system RelE/ParE family toxin [Asticcacaulis sp.]
MTEARWRIRLSRRVEADYIEILDTTVEKFGPRQAEIYERHLLAALTALEGGPDLRGSVLRPEVRTDLRTYHIARLGVSARHVICYRALEGRVIEVLRILHDAMDLPRHIPEQGKTSDAGGV